MKKLALIPIVAMLLTACGNNSNNSGVQTENNQTVISTELSQDLACNPTLFNDFKAVVVKDCAQCHKSMPKVGDFTDYNVAFAKKDLIRNRILVKKDMPMGKKLTAAEVDIIAKWLDAGAPPACATEQLSEQGLRVLEE